MRVDYILSVINSVESYFLEELEINLDRQDLKLRKSFSFPSEGIYVDLKGSVEGKILIKVSHDFGNYILNFMLGNVDIYDQELKLAALKELVNQVAAKIINKLDEEGFDLDISVPVSIEDESPKQDLLEMESLMVAYHYNEGSMEVIVAIKEKKQGEA